MSQEPGRGPAAGQDVVSDQRFADAAPAPITTNPTDAAGTLTADLGPLVSGVIDDLGTLARDEIELAKSELKPAVAAVAAGAAEIGAGAFAGGVGTLFLLLAVFEALSRKMPRWAAAGLVGLSLLGAAAKLGLGGQATLSRVNLKPEQTLGTLRENVAWAKQRLGAS